MKDLRALFRATSLPIEWQNANGAWEKETLHPLADRLSPETSLFGFFFCRRIAKPEEISYQVSELFMMQKKCLLVFDDQLLKDLVEMRRRRGYKGSESFLEKMILHVRFGPDDNSESLESETKTGPSEQGDL